MTPSLRHLLAVVVAFCTTIALLPSIVFADTGPVAPVAVSGTSHSLTLTPVAWTIITGLITPFLIALLTKYAASSTLKGVVGIVTAAVAGIVERATLADGSALFTTGLLVDMLLIYAPQLLTYLGLWSHININAKIAPSAGIGTPQPQTVVVV